MSRSKRIFIVFGMNYNPLKMLSQARKLPKGFIRLGHDVETFNYDRTLLELSRFKSKALSERLHKSKVDQLLADQIRAYEPDIIYIYFARALDAESVKQMRQAAPNAVYVGNDGDPWPKLQRNRIETARELDILTATNEGQWLQEYREAGVPLCAFLPNACDPDIERRYDVDPKWKADILWIGKLSHHADASETFREDLVKRLARRKDAVLHGCCGRPKIGGMDCVYAISGARIGVSVNAYGPIKFCHSDRLIRFLAGGTCVFARRFTGAECLFADGKHLRYFDEIDEFFELADWYLHHEAERKALADAGMERAHKEFSCQRIAQYVLDLVEKGTYDAPWTQS
ncbi:MAG: glycosyltransferase [Sedimentisphaerales bacterium]|nr:glycosyltransferase [Sedimentisphaerales bacterium]